ncbi:MAG: hypothetical protein ABH862_02775 [Candidatus Omnitrophota bacterium]
MEMDLKGIIEKIKKEGVSEAEKEVQVIISRAEEKAKKITEKAQKESEQVAAKARNEAAQVQANGEAALKQASRDTLISLKASIVKVFDNILREEIPKDLKPSAMEGAIINLIASFNKDAKTSLEILLNEEDKKTLEKTLLSKLKDKTKQEIVLKVSPSVESGFRIGEKDSNSYYDVTDEAVIEAFKSFLNPRIARIIDKK